MPYWSADLQTNAETAVYLFVLIGGDGYERRLLEGVRVEGVPPHREDVIGLDYVHTGLVLVHGVQNDLKYENQLLRTKELDSTAEDPRKSFLIPELCGFFFRKFRHAPSVFEQTLYIKKKKKRTNSIYLFLLKNIQF